MGEWQPIETAPRDGRTVLIFTNRPIRQWAIARWIGAPHNHWGDGYERWDATHWMPLPEPPK